MVYSVVAVTSHSVTIELLNNDIYKPSEPVAVYLDGERVMTADTNVFSLYHLQPDTQYRVSISGIEQSFLTKHESVLLDVRQFGAVGDGTKNDTASLQAAIMACPAEGTVYVPEGKYLTGPLFMKSSMTFWLDKGSELLGLTDREQYPVLPGMVRATDEKAEVNFASWEGNPLDCFASLITAIKCNDLDIIGEGTVNGQAEKSDWWDDPKHRHIAWRPNLIFLNRCTNVRVQGTLVTNSPCWTVHPYYSDHLQFLNLRIKNPYNSPNTDGFDPDSCKSVLLLGTVISVGDDCVAIKSGKLYMAVEHFRRADGIEIRNCLFENGHGAVTVGSEIAGGVNDVHVSQCIFKGTDRGVRIKSRRGRGMRSVLDGLFFEHIIMDQVHMPLTVNMFYFCDPDGHSPYVQSRGLIPADCATPVIGQISLSDVKCTGVTGSLITAYGLPESRIGCISIEKMDASFAPVTERAPEQTIMADDVPLMTGRSFVLKNVELLKLFKVTVKDADDNAPEMEGVVSSEINELKYERSH